MTSVGLPTSCQTEILGPGADNTPLIVVNYRALLREVAHVAYLHMSTRTEGGFSESISLRSILASGESLLDPVR